MLRGLRAESLSALRALCNPLLSGQHAASAWGLRWASANSDGRKPQGKGAEHPPTAASSNQSGGDREEAPQQQQQEERQQQQQQQQQAEEQQQEQRQFDSRQQGPVDPKLRAHIEQLRQLKGATRLQQQTLGQEEQPGLMTWVSTLLSGWLQTWLEGFVRDRVEKSFSAAEFLEGAKDAFFMVHQLISEQDWDTLRPMVSQKLLDATRSTFMEYDKAGLTWTQELEGDIDAYMRGVTFWTREQMAEYDEERASQAPSESPDLATAPAGLWLVATVSLHARQRVRISRVDNGDVLADLTDLRPQRFKFARGPLPVASYPVDQLEALPWFLVTI